MRRFSTGLALLATGYAGVAGGAQTSSNANCAAKSITWQAPAGDCTRVIAGYSVTGSRLADGKCNAVLPQTAMNGGPCHFDLPSRSFAGSAADQARCLLKHVKRGGELGEPDLTPALAALVDTPALPLGNVGRYLAARHITSAETGGGLVAGLQARYFVIHDTSSPNCSNLTKPTGSCPTIGKLPVARDTADWPDNQTFNDYLNKPADLKAHVITNRAGGSLSARDFSEHKSNIRFDYCHDADAKRGLFVGVENIQPRIARPGAAPPTKNDAIAPDPGFADAQYERLALLYVIASARHGRWLVPAYHAPIDAYYAGGHDDPQHFDMAIFMAKLSGFVAAIQRS